MTSSLAQLDAAIVECRRCSRLNDWCQQVAREKRAAYRDQEYWGKPVPGFGAAKPRIWIVGLAPAAHGANRTGRMFTGDRSGDWLFASMHRVGLAAQATSTMRGDGQKLTHVRLTAAVHCAPPANKPTVDEERACRTWLVEESGLVAPHVRVVVALGGIAWKSVRTALTQAGWEVGRGAFGHGAQASLRTPSGRDVTLLGSYHPSQQNTFTGRLTEPMLDAVLTQARDQARDRARDRARDQGHDQGRDQADARHSRRS